MAKIIFDEHFYDCENMEYLKDTIAFVKSYFDVNVLFLFSSNRINSTFFNMKVIIDKMISAIDNIEIVDVDELDNKEYDNEQLNSFHFSEDFLKVIEHYLSLKEELIIILTENLSENTNNRIGDIFIVNHIYKEIDSCIAKFISENKYVKGIIEPDKDNPLPNSKLCKLYKERQDELKKGKNIKELQALYYSIGKEVIMRNRYGVNHLISSLNPSVYGGVFSYNYPKKIYASVDIEHGAIEIFNKDGKHQDEYTYEGIARDRRDSEGHHDIRV